MAKVDAIILGQVENRPTIVGHLKEKTMFRKSGVIWAVLAAILVCQFAAVGQAAGGSPALVERNLTETSVLLALPSDELVPPPPPDVEPLIALTYPEDADGDAIADDLMNQVESARAARQSAQDKASVEAAEADISQLVDIQLVFSQPVEQWQIDNFLSLGGEITYIYQAVSYGWNGRIPLNQVDALPATCGGSLVLVEKAHPIQVLMRLATQTGRVRPVWANGFAGSASGYDGSTDISIAIIDTGLDGSHTDLAGRQAYWHDYTSDGALSPVDMQHHGSHVAGIALGSGASLGTGTQLNFTEGGNLTGVPSGSYFSATCRFDIAAATSDWGIEAGWTGTSPATLAWLYHTLGSTANYTIASTSSNSGDAWTLPAYSFLSTRNYSPLLVSNGGMGRFVTLNTLSNFAAVGDTFNTLRGVAPGCPWVGAKVQTEFGEGTNLELDSAIDDMVLHRIDYNIKVMNVSMGYEGDPGIVTLTRQKINTAANNGILPVSAAGNDGLESTAAAREIDDPARAAMVLTVGASNDVNRLTDYTSQGFSTLSTVTGQEEDYKPDVLAPGGSKYYSHIMSVDSNSSDAPDDTGYFTTDFVANDYANMLGTSMASPFAAGCAALVIDSLQSTGGLTGGTWDFYSGNDVRRVKMLLCATATETNANRENTSNNPTLQRASNGPSSYPASKDMYEGYGMLNVDAAIEGGTVLYTLASSASSSFDGTATGRRAWARRVSLTVSSPFQPRLTVPAAGDYDLYLYSLSPSTFGTPVILASSTNSGTGVTENINYTPTATGGGVLVVKRVSGSGTFTVADVTAPAPPVITTNGGANFTTNVAALTLTGTCAADTNAIRMNGSATGVTYTPGATTWSYTKTLTTQGANLFSVTALDLATNVSVADTITVTFDNIPPAAPVITTNSGNNFLTNVAALTLNGTCAADTNAIQVNGSAAGVTYVAGQTTWSYAKTLTTQGANLFSVTALDLATNVSVADTITVTFDNIPPAAPVITTNSGNNFLTNVAALTLNGTCAADTNAIQVNGSAAGVTYVAGQTTWSYAKTLTTQGANLFTVTALDLATNVSAADTITVTFDNIAPAAPVITAPNGGADFLTNVAALTLSGTCAADTNAIRVNDSATGVTYTPGATTWSYATTLSTQGANLFSVTALDLATNVSVADTITVTFDNTAPTAPVVSGATPTNDTTPTWSWVSGGGGSEAYRYQLDSEAGTWSAETTDVSFTPVTPLSLGAHTLYVQERDAVPNWSASGSSVIHIQPLAPVLDAEPATTYGTANTISWASVAEADEYYIEYDTSDTFPSPDGNSGWIAGLSHEFTGLTDGGTYYYRVKARTLIPDPGGDYYEESFWSNTVSSTQAVPRITVTSPTTGTVWERGTVQTIRWTSVGIPGNVRIYYSTSGSTSTTGPWTPVGWGTPYQGYDVPNDGEHEWQVNAPVSGNVTILVRSMSQDIPGLVNWRDSDGISPTFTVSAESNPAFITVTAPAAGANWKQGTVHNVTWNSNGVPGDVKLYYSTNGGSTWTAINYTVPNTGSYAWTVNAGLAPGGTALTNVKVRVRSKDVASLTDDSDPFTISPPDPPNPPFITVTAPATGANWKQGTVHNVTWNSNGVPGDVKLYYSTNGGSTWTGINYGAPNTGSYAWTVDAGLTPGATALTNAKVRVRSKDLASLTDDSDLFTISPPDPPTNLITLAPTPVAIGQVLTIGWPTEAISGLVKIYYSLDGGASWTGINYGAPNTGSYAWTVNAGPSTNARIRVRSKLAGEFSGDSDVFGITN